MSGAFNFPTAPDGSMSGSQFASSIYHVPMSPGRDLAIKQQILLGNIPSFLRQGIPVGVQHGDLLGVIWVLPDYLAVGNDEDFVRVPMGPRTATEILDQVSATLPTRAMVNAIWEHASVKLPFSRKAPTNDMMSTGYFLDHNRKIQEDLVGQVPGPALIAGHKKDVVLCHCLGDGEHSDRVAIYGGCAEILDDGGWKVIQDLNASSHNYLYCDYSHGIRGVSNMMMVGEQYMHISDVLQSPELCGLISDEGVYTLTRYPNT